MARTKPPKRPLANAGAELVSSEPDLRFGALATSPEAQKVLAETLREGMQGNTLAMQQALLLIWRSIDLGQPLQPVHAAFLAERILEIAFGPGGPFGVPLVTRTPAQARHDREDEQRLAETARAWVSVLNAPRGAKTEQRGIEAEKLGIDIRQLEARFKMYGLRFPSALK